MRLLVQLPDSALATRFGDYLTASGIGNDVEPGESSSTIWIHNDDHVDRAKRELETYLAHPLALQYQQANDIAKRVRAEEAQRGRKQRLNYVDVRTAWATKGMGGGGAVPLTLFLIAASCLVTFFTNFGDMNKSLTWKMWIDSGSGDQELVAFLRSIGMAAQLSNGGFLHDVLHGQVWRLVSPIFVHMSIMHLLFNMLWLWQLGGMIERRKGTAWMALLVFSTGIAANIVQYWWDGPLGGGMSGVVYALFGYAWMKGKFQPQENLYVPQQTVTIMIVWLFACMTGLLGPIGNAAHVTGLLGGMALGHGTTSWRRVKQALKRNEQ